MNVNITEISHLSLGYRLQRKGIAFCGIVIPNLFRDLVYSLICSKGFRITIVYFTTRAYYLDNPRLLCYSSTQRARVLEMAQLGERQELLLKLIISEYISSATPVGSNALAKRYALGLSPATLRHEMVKLEEQGYIDQPHTSAGRVPTDKGYRYFVECLLGEKYLSLDEQYMIRHQFHQVETELDQWMRLAAAVLAHITHSAALVSMPTSPKCRLKHLELIEVQDRLALLIVVLLGGLLRQQKVNFPAVVVEEELTRIAHRMTELFKGLTTHKIEKKRVALSPNEQLVKEALIKLMHQVDLQSYQEIYFDGLMFMLTQPEFTNAEKMRLILEFLQQRSALASLVNDVLEGGELQVLIGRENKWPPLRECSVIFAQYGVEGGLKGALGVLGPTRMHYGRIISSVRYVSTLMTDLWRELYP